ncbi:MAG: hypothetical protein J6B98_00965 [Bacilli bacterium]|nr:hypothetical protein [Bacilli bacterium]
MKKIVIAGSAKLQDKVNYWKDKFEKENYQVLDYPKEIDKCSFIDVYPDVHKEFFEKITKTDILFIMNEDKNSIDGYIGAETFAELTFGLSQNLLYGKNIELLILKMPDEKVSCYNEIKLWLELGWIKIYNKK